MLLSETTRDLVLATSLTATAVGLVFSIVYKSPRKPRRRFKGDRPPAVARIPGKVSPKVVAARISNLAVIAGIALAFWMRGYRHKVAIVTDRGVEQGLTREAIGNGDDWWYIVNRSSHALTYAKLMNGEIRDTREIPPNTMLDVQHLDAIGPDRAPDPVLNQYAYWLTWN